jgi:hypothetical protein
MSGDWIWKGKAKLEWVWIHADRLVLLFEGQDKAEYQRRSDLGNFESFVALALVAKAKGERIAIAVLKDTTDIISMYLY